MTANRKWLFSSIISLTLCSGTEPGQFLAHSPFFQSQQPSPAQSTLLDDLARSVDRELVGGESHNYLVSLKANDFLQLSMETTDIEVVGRLLGPDGNVLAETTTSTGLPEPVLISFIAQMTGSYQIQVASSDKASRPGRYQLSIQPIREATLQDREQVAVYDQFQHIVQICEAGNLKEALPLTINALEIAEKVFGSEHRIVARHLNLLGLIHDALSDFNQAETAWQRALTIREKALGPMHPEVAQSLHNLAGIHQSKGDLARAEDLFVRALAIREKVFGREHPAVARSLNNLASLYQAKGDLDQAEVTFQRLVTVQEKILGADHPELAAFLNNLAVVYQAQGEYEKAEPLYQRALIIWEKNLAPEHPNIVQCLSNLGGLYFARGDYTRTEPFYQRVLAIREKLYGPDHLQTAQSLNNLATLYYEKGDKTQAELLFQKVLAIREKALGPDHPTVADSLNNLGMVYWSRKDAGQAEPLLQRVLVLREKKLGPHHFLVAQTLNNLALIVQAKGDYPQAEQLFARALGVYEKSLGPEHPDFANALNNLARLFQKKGEFDRAETLFEQALAIREKSLGPEHPDVADTLSNLAELFLTTGKLEAAVVCQQRTNEIQEHTLAGNLITGSERQKRSYLNQTTFETDNTISMHVQSVPGNERLQKMALTIILRRKGRGLDAFASNIETLRRHAQPADQQLLDDLGQKKAQLARLTQQGPKKEKHDEFQTLMKQMEHQVDQLESQISLRSAEFSAQTQPITLEAIQQAIPSLACLIEFASYRPFDAKNQTHGSPHYVVYTLTYQGTLKWADLGKAEVIDRAVAELRTLVKQGEHLPNFTSWPGKSKSIRSWETQTRLAARELDALIMNPVRAIIGNQKHLLISPDGALNLVPFAALVDESGHYLVENYTITYLTSGRDLLRLKVKLPNQSPALFLADPDYKTGEGPRLAGIQYHPLLRLEGTADEGKALKRLFPHSRLKMRETATEQILRTVNRPTILHIATHSYVLGDTTPGTPQTAANRSIVLKSLDNSTNGIRLEAQNPLLQSWIFFAGANRGGDDASDGIMTAFEVSNLDLWGTKLAVLSGCDTGVGTVKNRDGVYGLRRALVLAGSESQMISLWPVSDQATKALMIEYYTRLKAGEGRSEALRNVQLKMLKHTRYRHPYFWASFIQSGEWANLEGKQKQSDRKSPNHQTTKYTKYTKRIR